MIRVGPEWNSVLVILAVLAALVVLAMWNPWAGVIAFCLLFWVGVVWVYVYGFRGP